MGILSTRTFLIMVVRSRTDVFLSKSYSSVCTKLPSSEILKAFYKWKRSGTVTLCRISEIVRSAMEFWSFYRVVYMFHKYKIECHNSFCRSLIWYKFMSLYSEEELGSSLCATWKYRDITWEPAENHLSSFVGRTHAWHIKSTWSRSSPQHIKHTYTPTDHK
jgi:hypothetical protein